MKNTQLLNIKHLIFLILVTIGFLSYSIEKNTDFGYVMVEMPQADSLILEKHNGAEISVIKKNQSLKIWTGTETTKGRLVAVENGKIVIRKKKDTIRININEITKIKTASRENGRMIIGASVMYLGIALTAQSSVLVAVSIASLIIDNELYIVYTAPILAISLGIVKLGDLIFNKRFSPNNGWKITNS